MSATALGSIASLVVGGLLASVSVLGMVNSQVNGGEQQVDVSAPKVPYGDSN